MNAAVAWARVHRWRSGLALIAAGAVVAITAGDVVVVRFASNQVAVALLVPLLSGLAVPVACAGPGIRVLDPLRAKAARVFWALLWIAAGGLLVAGVFEVEPHDVATSQALLRNLLLVVALSLWCSAVGLVEVSWLPPTVYAMLCLQFGGVGAGTARWAAFADPHATTNQLVVAAAMCAASVSLYGVLHGRS